MSGVVEGPTERRTRALDEDVAERGGRAAGAVAARRSSSPAEDTTAAPLPDRRRARYAAAMSGYVASARIVHATPRLARAGPARTRRHGCQWQPTPARSPDRRGVRRRPTRGPGLIERWAASASAGRSSRSSCSTQRPGDASRPPGAPGESGDSEAVDRQLRRDGTHLAGAKNRVGEQAGRPGARRDPPRAVTGERPTGRRATARGRRAAAPSRLTGRAQVAKPDERRRARPRHVAAARPGEERRARRPDRAPRAGTSSRGRSSLRRARG